MKNPMQCRFAAFVMGVCLLGLAPAAMAGPAEEAFVRAEAERGLSILNDKSITHEQRTALFGAFIDDVTNERLISRFVLGKYARGLPAEQMTAFRAAFTQWAKSVYQGQLAKYGGEHFKTESSVDRRPGDSVVTTEISGGALEKPLQVRWRVLTRDGETRIVDLEAFGVWLAIQQRSEITAYIANHQGSVTAATQMLVAKVAEKQSSPETVSTQASAQ